MSRHWQPTAPIENLKMRARILQQVRAFFLERGVLEVDTPSMSHAGLSEPNIESFQVTNPDNPLYLHTSPEFPMKRLLAAGSGSIYQIAKVYRQGESGRFHNPEFTLLEWYREGWDYRALMDEIAELITAIIGYERLEQAPEWLSYCEAFLRYLAINPLTASTDELARCAVEQGIELYSEGEGMERSGWLDLLFAEKIQPHLGRGRISFIYDYPAEQASLARLKPEDSSLAERFELFIEGVELGNGFGELTDASEQRLRFKHELEIRNVRGAHLPPLDERFLAALEHGLPECSGVAIGIDRLLMVVLDADSIDEVIAFPIERS
ncbi:MAG: EF-P lysine aminoacylase EpmA [Gammaproteobacteria bacterium]|nr:EF-P lysine aminoacylase EpmA [Gammaproteobacteria bacterium]